MEITEQEFQQMKQQLAESAANHDALKEGLDSALAKLEELSKKPTQVTPAPEAKKEPEKAPEQKKVDPEDPEDKEAEEFIKGVEADRQRLNDLGKVFGQFMVKQELTALRSEINAAQAKFMNSDIKDILLGIQQNPNADVMKLAEASHNKFVEKTKTMQTEIEAKVREQLKKEAEGGTSIPQGSGVTPTPQPRNQVVREEDEWANALKASKSGLTV